MQWRVNIIVCHSNLAAFQTFKVYQYETRQGNRLAAKRIIEIGLVELDLPSHPIFHLNDIYMFPHLVSYMHNL